MKIKSKNKINVDLANKEILNFIKLHDFERETDIIPSYEQWLHEWETTGKYYFIPRNEWFYLTSQYRITESAKDIIFFNNHPEEIGNYELG